MQIPWKRYFYGTLTLITTIGGSLYYFGGNTAKNQVRPEDVIELMEGARERSMAICNNSLIVGTGSLVRVNWTNDVYGYLVPNGTNAPTWTNYLVEASNTNILYTNIGNNAVGGMPNLFSNNTSFIIQQGLYIWCGSSNLLVTNFWMDGTVWGDYYYSSNGTYSLVGYDSGSQAYYYTNTLMPARTDTNYWLVLILRDRGYYNGWEIGMGITYGSNYYPNSAAEWAANWFDTYATTGAKNPFYKTWTHIYGSMNTNMQVRALDCYTNLIRNAPAFFYETRPNAVGIQVMASNMTAISKYLSNAIPHFVDDSLMTNGTFDTWFQSHPTNTTYPMLTMTGLFARLGIGDLTNRFTAVPASISTNGARYGIVSNQIYKIHLEERYKVINALKYTANNNTYWTNAVGVTGVVTNAWSDSEYYAPPADTNSYREDWITNGALSWNFDTHNIAGGTMAAYTNLSMAPQWQYSFTMSGSEGRRRKWVALAYNDENCTHPLEYNTIYPETGNDNLSLNINEQSQEQIISKMGACVRLDFQYLISFDGDIYVRDGTNAAYFTNTITIDVAGLSWAGDLYPTNAISDILAAPAIPNIISNQSIADSVGTDNNWSGYPIPPPPPGLVRWGGYYGGLLQHSESLSWENTKSKLPVLMKWQFRNCTNTL